MVFDQQSYSSVDYNISTVKAKSTCSNHASHRNKKEHKVKDFQETISGNFQSLDITVPDITTGNKKNRKEKKRRKKEIGTAKREAKNAEIRKVRDRLVIACFFALIFMCVEIVGGIMAGSLAIVTDAAHLLSDIFGFATAILASTLALRPSSDSHTFGLVRAEVLSALINTAMIVVLAGFLLYEGILKLVKWAKGEDEPINGFIMMIVALVGVFFNIILMVVFGAEHEATHSHDHCHGHSHSHGHHHHHSHNHDDHQAMIYPMSGISKNDEDNVTLLDIEASRSHYGSTDVNNISKEETHNHHHHHHHKNSIDENNYETASNESQSPIHWTKNINLEAAHLHVWTDLLQSVGVAIAGILIYFKPEWSIVDPIITIVFSIFIVISTFKVLFKSVHILLEGVPSWVNLEQIRSRLNNIEGVSDVHDLHLWMLSLDKPIATVHLKADDTELALKKAHKIFSSMGIHHATVQVQHEKRRPTSTYESVECVANACQEGDCM